MLSRREDFFLDIRRAVRLEQQPKVTTDSDVLSEDRIAKALQGATLWLTPKIVENYAEEDFGQCSPELRQRLASAVLEFGTACGDVPPSHVPTSGEYARALAAFQGLTTAVREIVLTEWTQTVDSLMREVEGWIADSAWRARRVERKMSETLLGAYTLPQLQVFADADLYVLEPVARFVPGAMGAYDLSIQPSYYITTLYRHFDGLWYAHLDVGQGVADGRRSPWNQETFRASVKELRSLV